MPTILIHYGKDPAAMAGALLDVANPPVDPGMRILLKPNLVVAKPCSEGATTSPEMTAGVLAWLMDKGCRNLAISESAWIGERTSRAFDLCGYTALAKRFGVKLIDLSQDKAQTVALPDGTELKICESVLAADVLINLPVVKAHCQTHLTCALKNLKGCIPHSEKRRYHSLGLHKPIAQLNHVLRPLFTLADGMCGDLTFEEGGHPVQMDRLLYCDDPVALDAYCAALIGLAPERVEYIRLAESLGVGKTAPLTLQTFGAKQPAPAPTAGLAQRLTRNVDARSACSACYAGLVHGLYRLSDQGQMPRAPLHIGQGFRGQKAKGLGIGQCCAGFTHHVPGCPPTGHDILQFLSQSESLWND